MGYLDNNGLSYFWGKIKTLINGKQDTLVSGTNIKTVNNESLLGSGNITIQGGGGQQQQADWSQSDSSAVDYIKNKPTNLVTGSLGECTVWSGTLADYNALGAHDPSTLYFITAAATPQNYTLWFGSAAEYAAIVTKDSSTLYFVTE